MRYRTQSQNRHGFGALDVVAVIVGLVLLAVVFFPALIRPSNRDYHNARQSMFNLSQLGKAMKHYEGLGRGNLKTRNWQESLEPFVDDRENVFTDPLDENGLPSYGLNDRVALMDYGDANKIAIIESDNEVIAINAEDCRNGQPTIHGSFAVRYFETVRALLYSGAVRAFEPDEIDLTDDTYQPFVTWWLPHEDENTVCGKVIEIDNEGE